MGARRLTLAQKKEIFEALVSTQDSGLMTVRQSYEKISLDYGITEEQLRSIEEEGLENEWPPLSGAGLEVG